MNNQLLRRLFCLLLSGLPFLAQAQRGYSDASVAMNRANGVVSPDQVVVEEYLNYHTHRIALPQAPAKVALDMSWGNSTAARLDSVAVLQVGLATAQLHDFSHRRPTNVCIVVDRSGSMAAESRLEKVKAALREFARGLQPDDWVSVVAYDDAVTVPLAAQPLQRAVFEQAVDGLQPGGSTNLHAGMMQGYAEVMKHFRPEYTNRVILLTDGLANSGVTEPEQIVAASAAYNDRGVEISTIGVGSSVNFQLLRQLAQRGRGLNHFIGADPEDMRKTFDQELESLLAVVGRSATLELTYPAGLQLLGVVGYQPQLEPGRVRLPLNNLNAGLTQVVLLRFRVRPDAPAKLPVHATLRYEDAAASAPASLTKASTLRYEPGHRAGDPLLDDEVRKNYFIGYMATALRQVAQAAAQGEQTQALALGYTALRTVDVNYPALKDADLRRVRDILERNLGLLRGEPTANGARPGYRNR